MQYISSVARVASSGIHFSSFGHSGNLKDTTVSRDDSRQYRYLGATIRVRIEVDRLPFRPLRCSDPGACNFNEVTTALFNASDSSSTDFCSYACKTISHKTVKSTSQSTASTLATTTTPKTGASINVENPTSAFDLDCLTELYLGIGIGVGGFLAVGLVYISITYSVLRCMGFKLEKSSSYLYREIDLI